MREKGRVDGKNTRQIYIKKKKKKKISWCTSSRTLGTDVKRKKETIKMKKTKLPYLSFSADVSKKQS